MKQLSVTILLVVIFILSIIGCKSTSNTHRSSLLDSAKATFLGDSAINEYLGTSAKWDDQNILLIGIRKAFAKGKNVESSGFVWLVNEEGKIVWDKSTPDLRPMDAVAIDDSNAFVLFNRMDEQHVPVFVVLKYARNGNAWQKLSRTMPEHTAAAYIEKISDDHFMIVTWCKSASDTNEYDVDNVHLNAQCELLENHWDLTATKLFPLQNGDFLGIRDNASRKERCTTQIMRIRNEGTTLWMAEKVMEPMNAAIYGVTETKNGDILLSAFSEKVYAPLLALYSADGEKIWVKSPPEMQGCRIYDIAPYKENQFIIAAQKTMSRGSFSTSMWDALAAFVIDDKGTILDYDVVPQYWTIPLGGVVPLNPDKLIFLGTGSKAPKEFLKQNDIALYTLKL